MKRVAVAGVLVGVVGVGIVFLLWLSAERPAPPRAEAAAKELAGTGQLSAAPTQEDNRTAVPTGSVEMCGYGPYVPTELQTYPAEIVDQARTAMDQAAAALAKSQIDSERALGLFAQSVAAWRRVYDDQASLQAQCASDERCVQRAQIAAQRAAEPFVQELARVAGGSRDPRAYALAAYRCASFYVQRPSAGACSVISAESWAQLEPDNLTPWLFVAQSADAAKDARARDDALYRASKAKYVNTHWDSVFPLVETSLLARADPAVQLVAHGDVLGVYAAFPLAQYQHVVNYCRKDALADGIRRQSCNELATLLVNRSSTLVDLRVGTAVGERLGWSLERLQALRDESDALQYVSSQALSSSDFHSCEALRRIQTRAQALGRHGEIGADRLAAAASGKSHAELARGWRAHVAKVRAESERARKERR